MLFFGQNNNRLTRYDYEKPNPQIHPRACLVWRGPIGFGTKRLARCIRQQRIPEPTTLALAGLGGLSLLFFCRRTICA
ncbi:MAG: PEP-CTERM sorting domain-containing protein [Limisphaerales bacterium]